MRNSRTAEGGGRRGWMYRAAMRRRSMCCRQMPCTPPGTAVRCQSCLKRGMLQRYRKSVAYRSAAYFRSTRYARSSILQANSAHFGCAREPVSRTAGAVEQPGDVRVLSFFIKSPRPLLHSRHAVRALPEQSTMRYVCYGARVQAKWSVAVVVLPLL